MTKIKELLMKCKHRSSRSALVCLISLLLPWIVAWQACHAAEAGGTVREICVGRPRASLPVKTRTTHTPGCFSRTVATASRPGMRRRLWLMP